VLADTPELPVERNAMTATEHPRGAVLQIGCRLRYLILWSHGVPDGPGLAAPALHLAASGRCPVQGVRRESVCKG